MNRFSRIRHHVDIKDVKRRHLEESSAKKLEEKRLKEEAQQIKAKYEKCKVDWRSELDEGMTTGKLYATTFPSEGDTPIEQLSASDTESFADAINMFGAGANNNALDGATIRPNGTGTGGNVLGNIQPYGGFNVGGDYLAFQNTGTTGSRFALMKPIDSTAIDTLTITGIAGHEFNGGQITVHPNAQLFVIYKTPSMNRALYLSQDPNIKIPVIPSNRQFLQSDPQIPPQDSMIMGLALGRNPSTPTDLQFSIPAHAREKGTVFGLFQLAHSGGVNAANYGVTNIKFQRKAPVNAFVSLEDPEASSFVRVGQGTKKSSPQKRKKRVQDILSAGKEYANKYLGSDFPGSSTELSPETSPKVSSVDQEIADVQQQKRDSMSQQTKDRFDGDQPETMNNEPKVPDFTKFNNSKDMEDAYQATYQQYQKDLEAALKNYGKEAYNSWLKGAQSNWDNFAKKRPGGPRSPRPTYDAEQENTYITNAVKGYYKINYKSPAGKAIKAIIDAQNERLFAYVDAQNQLRKRSQKDKAVNPQAEPVKDEGGEDVDVAQTMADIEKFAPEITQQEINLDDVKSLEDLPQNKVLEIIAKLGRFQTGGLSLPFDLTIKYAMGDYTPVTKSPGAAFDNVTLRAIENAHIKYPGRNKVSTDNYLDIPSRFAQAAFQHFDYEVTPKGIRVKDDFNFNDPDNPASTHIGWFAIFDDYLPHKIKAQTIATNLIKIGDKRAQMLGYDPRDDQFGIPINYIIPYHRLSKKQKKLFYPELFRNENKRGSVFNKIKQIRGGS